MVRIFALTLLALACQRSKPTEKSAPAPPASLAKSALPAAPPPAAAPAPEAHLQPSAACRVMRTNGDVRFEGGDALKRLGDLDGRRWVVLAEKSELVVRHSESAREFSIAGPALVLPCRLGQEQVLLARGKFTSSKGTGVRPGAEVWIGTPYAVLRYGDADLEVEVGKSELSVKARAGETVAEAAEGLRGPKADGRLPPGSQAKKRGRPDADALTRACEKAAANAQASAKLVLAATKADLGRLAAEQMRDRREARARCLLAETALATLEPAERARLGDLLVRAEATWRGVPRASPGATP